MHFSPPRGANLTSGVTISYSRRRILLHGVS